MAFVELVAGLVVLVLGAEVLVRGASRLAIRLGISPVVVGLTVVAFGTSSPELAVSLSAAWGGRGDLVTGNAVGSNIFNVMMILGVSALIVPLAVQQRMIRVDVPLLVGVGLLVWGLLSDGQLGRLDGALLFTGIVIYTVTTVRFAKNEPAAVLDEYAEAVSPPPKSKQVPWRSLVFIVIGLGLCVLGSRWMVSGAVTLAEAIGLSERVVGLTIVAAGTSLPELATSIMAALRGQRDIAVGNVIGSNIFNLLGILGLTGILSPEAIAVPGSVLSLDLPVMIGVAVICVPIVITGYRISRMEGAAFLLLYIGYVAYLILVSQGHAAADPLGKVMLWGAVPLMLLGVLVSVWVSLHDRRRLARS